MKILISNSSAALEAALTGSLSGTVEAEYGDVVVEGSEWTLAHHGPRADQPAPCLTRLRLAAVDVVGVSHVDLDTLMGIGGALGLYDYASELAELVAHVDIHGVHRAPDHPSWGVWQHALNAWWAWSADNRCHPPRDGSVEDVTKYVQRALDMLDSILRGAALAEYKAGRVWAASQNKLDTSSLVTAGDGVIIRSASAFVNHLYRTGNSDGVQQAVVALNTGTRAVTVSFEDGGGLASACEIVQALWGPEAGGRRGIAGSPRGQAMTADDCDEAANVAALALHGLDVEVAVSIVHAIAGDVDADDCHDRVAAVTLPEGWKLATMATTWGQECVLLGPDKAECHLASLPGDL